jgi:creatinine amidohydrolase
MAQASVLMAELSWTAYARRVEAGAPVIVPVGSTEQHALHLPLGCDALLVGEMAKRAARRVGALVAPTVSYGYKSQPRSGGGNHFPGTTSFDGETLTFAIRDVVRELARHGVRKVVVLDGHYENGMFLTEGIDLALRDLKAWGIDGVRVLKMLYCETVKQETLDLIFPNGFPGMALEHAANLETSMMLHLFPHLVDRDAIPSDPPHAFPPYDIYPTPEGHVRASGVLSTAAAATAEFGRLLASEFEELVSTSITRAFATG